jgi:two-component system OmpR family response regulator
MSEPGAVLRVLCADDNRDTADTQAVVLELAGCLSRACYDGTTAVAAALWFHPDACVLDLNMPGLDGDEVAARVRGSAGGAGVVLVAVSGLPAAEARARATAAGFDLFLTKPCDPERLAAAILDLAARRLHAAARPAERELHRGEPRECRDAAWCGDGTMWEGLGATPEAVAAALRALGVRGVRNTVRTLNPVVRYALGELRTARAADLIAGDRLRVEMTGGEVAEVPVPEAVLAFLAAFHRGDHPDLELAPDAVSTR